MGVAVPGQCLCQTGKENSVAKVRGMTIVAAVIVTGVGSCTSSSGDFRNRVGPGSAENSPVRSFRVFIS